MVDHHLLGNERRREHAVAPQRADRGNARRQRAFRFGVALGTVLRWIESLDEEVAAKPAGVAREHREDVDQIRCERREEVVLDCQVEHDRRRLGFGVLARHRDQISRRDAGATRHLVDVDLGERLP
jgi:hypothetical protein